MLFNTFNCVIGTLFFAIVRWIAVPNNNFNNFYMQHTFGALNMFKTFQ